MEAGSPAMVLELYGPKGAGGEQRHGAWMIANQGVNAYSHRMPNSGKCCARWLHRRSCGVSWIPDAAYHGSRGVSAMGPLCLAWWRTARGADHPVWCSRKRPFPRFICIRQQEQAEAGFPKFSKWALNANMRQSAKTQIDGDGVLVEVEGHNQTPYLNFNCLEVQSPNL